MRFFSKRLGWVFWFCGVISLGSQAQTLSPESQFQSANTQVASGHPTEGLGLYNTIHSAEKTTAALEYNRGVAYSRLGDHGRAYAHWRLAERLDPRHPAIQSALKRSASLPGMPAEDSSESMISWTDRLTLTEWGVLAGILTWSWGALLLIGRWKAQLGTCFRGYTLGLGILAVTCIGLLAGSGYRRTRLPDAILLKAETQVRISPLDEARSGFTLAGGTPVRSTLARPGWYLVEDPSTRRFGWIKSEEILRLPLR